MNWIEEVKNLAKIEDIVKLYIGYVAKHNSAMIRCPFHVEKTASMSINVAKNIFHCFGCGVGGDPIKFVEKIEKVNFIDACKKIADFYGIQTNSINTIHSLPSKNIANWCAENLQYKPQAIEYLKLRGIDHDMINKFSIGWMPKDFRTFCKTNNITQEALDRAGFKDNIINIFENRIIFPIKSLSNNVIAFGARCILGTKPKYINTSDTDMFHKKETLYGINFIKQNDLIFLVEGYFDVLVCAQFGFKALAPLGTATSIYHLQKCLELTNDLVICMDGDTAGKNAANKILHLILSIIQPGKSVKFVNLPNDKDPGSYLDKQTFLYDMQKQNTLIDQLWNSSNLEPLNTPENKAYEYKKMINALDVVQNRELRILYRNEIQKKWREFNYRKFEKKTNNIIVNHNRVISPKTTYEIILFGVILYNPIIFDHVCDYILNLDINSPFFEFREFLVVNSEFLIKNNHESLDKIDNFIIKSVLSVCKLSKIIQIAPFMQNKETIIAGWFEVYCLYIQYIYRSKTKNDQ